MRLCDQCLGAKELAAIKERRAQVCANNAIEGIRYTPEQEAMFALFDDQALPHEERLWRVLMYIKSGRLPR